MLNAGRLRHRIVLQVASETQDMATGAMEIIWVNLAELWAAIEPLSAREFVAGQSEQSKINTKIIIRYRNDLTAKMRIFHTAKAKYYNIEGLLDDKETGYEYITIACSEGVKYQNEETPS